MIIKRFIRRSESVTNIVLDELSLQSLAKRVVMEIEAIDFS